MSVRSRFTVLTTAAVVAAGPAFFAPTATAEVGDTMRVSVASDETGGGGRSSHPSISADGRLVAFHTFSRNLVPGDHSPRNSGVYVRDLETGTTELVAAGRYEPDLSADGRFLTFRSGDGDLFVHDRASDVTERIESPFTGELRAASPSISDDGGAVAFRRFGASPGVYVHDLTTGRTETVVEFPDEDGVTRQVAGPVLSGSGRHVAFRVVSEFYRPQPTVVESVVLVHGRVTGTTTELDRDSEVTEFPIFDPPSLSVDGRYVAWSSLSTDLVAGDTNRARDVFVRDLVTGVTERASVGPDGSQSGEDSLVPALSADGRHVAFQTYDGDLAGYPSPGIEVVVRDLRTGTTRAVSSGLDADTPGGINLEPTISADGRYVAYYSTISDLVPSDTNGVTDVFVTDVLGGTDGFPTTGPGDCPDGSSVTVRCSTDRQERLVFRGTHYDEVLVGTSGHDVLRGAGGADVLLGRGGADRLVGGAGPDELSGHSGADRMYGGPGRDTLLGGAGRVRRG